MFNHSPRRTRAAILATLATLTVSAVPTSIHALPQAGRTNLAQADPITPDRSGELLDACPLDGTATFVDSWGWSRSGGRSHEGVDMIAERGTPVIAVRDGDAVFKTNGLGGRAVWLTADNGDRFYYAHLDDWNGESRTVEAGELIGFVGSTGNAGGPHLHFETHPSDDVENPYPHTFRACVPDLSGETSSNSTDDIPFQRPPIRAL